MSTFPLLLRYSFPTICFCLGTWQLYRMQWKNDQIRELEGGLGKAAIKIASLPEDLDSVRHRRVKLYGEPDMSATPVFLGPRGATDIGVNFATHFILPFRLSDRTRILVDYGRVPVGQEGSISVPAVGHVEAMLGSAEKRSVMMPKNDPEHGKWLHKDLDAMSRLLDTEPVIFNRISKSVDKGSLPIATPPKIDVPNRHFEYVVTWYGIAAASLALSFLRK